jgi:hypothetical protein
MAIFQQSTDTRATQPLQTEKCASNLVGAALVLLLLQPYPLFHDNRARRLAEQEESLASVKTTTLLLCVPSASKNDPVQSGSTV